MSLTYKLKKDQEGRTSKKKMREGYFFAEVKVFQNILQGDKILVKNTIVKVIT